MNFLLNIKNQLTGFLIGLTLLTQSVYPNKISLAPIIKTEKVKVSYVIDGDTIVIEGGEKVRYIGINTSEIIHPTPVGSPSYECFAKEAYLENKNLVAGKVVRLVGDTSNKDKYGRLLRYVYVDDIFVNDYLVRLGYAKVMPIKPDTKFADKFYEDQKLAKKDSLGLWKICITPTPTPNRQ